MSHARDAGKRQRGSPSMCGASFGPLEDHDHVSLRHDIPTVAAPATAARSIVKAVGTLPPRIGVRKVPADIARRHGPEDGVGQRVADRVAVRVAVRPAVERNPDAAEDERAALHQPVQVVPDARSHDPRILAASSLDGTDVRSSPPAIVTFTFDASLVDDPHRVAGAFGQHGLVGSVHAACVPAQRHRPAPRDGTPVASAPGRSDRAPESRPPDAHRPGRR
jgi:hypothetical protein